MTGRDLISASLRLIGVLASGETPSANEASDALASFNRMLDGWSTEKLLIYQITEESPITLVGGQTIYHLGAGGDITTRPMEIVKGVIRASNIDYPIAVHLSTDQYAEIPNKTAQSAFPYDLYDDGGYPQRTLKLFPVPSTGNQLILWTKRPLTTIATLDTTLSFPPGYERALVYNGALELAPEYGRAVPETVEALAVVSKADIKRANKKPVYMECENGITGGGRWDINIGDYRT